MVLARQLVEAPPCRRGVEHRALDQLQDGRIDVDVDPIIQATEEGADRGRVTVDGHPQLPCRIVPDTVDEGLGRPLQVGGVGEAEAAEELMP